MQLWAADLVLDPLHNHPAVSAPCDYLAPAAHGVVSDARAG